jgi:superfamily II DNA helicase RecQ
MEGEFSQRIHYPREQIYIYRGRTSRSNVAYRVWRPEVKSPYQWERDPTVIIFMQARIRQARQAGGKVVIYANQIQQVQAMAEVFGCEAYHSRQVDRAGVLEWFIQGITDVIAATNALGMGVDIPNIRVIFHIGAPRTLLDYAQESGRAGRDGQASEAIIIQPRGMEGGGPDAREKGGEDNQVEEAQLVQRYIAGGECRRVVLDEYLDGMVDGYQRQRCGDDHTRPEQACDQCDPG